MFNLTSILTYLQASNPTTYDFSQEDPGAIIKDSSSKYMILCLISVTAMTFFHIRDRRELRKKDQRQQDRLATLENCMMDITGGLLPMAGCPLLDEDDDFKLPPPAYELHEGTLED